MPEVDKILAPYAKKSYVKYYKEYNEMPSGIYNYCTPEDFMDLNYNKIDELAEKYATKKVQRDFEQGWQGIEYKLNTVGSSRGDYPFVTMTIGLATDKFGKMVAITLLNVHKEGQGKKDLSVLCYSPKLYFCMIRTYMEMVINSIQMQMYLMQELTVVVKQCILTGYL